MKESGSRKDNNDPGRIVSASELAEFDYCALSWYYTREGYRGRTESINRMAQGTVQHEEADMDYRKKSGNSLTIAIAIILVTLLMIFLFL